MTLSTPLNLLLLWLLIWAAHPLIPRHRPGLMAFGLAAVGGYLLAALLPHLPSDAARWLITGVLAAALVAAGAARARQQPAPAAVLPPPAPDSRLRFMAQLLDNVQESVVSTDLAGRIIYWNKGAERLYGYSPEEATGKPITFIVTPGEVSEEEGRMRAVREQGSWSGEYIQQRRDGTSFLAQTLIVLVRDEQGVPVGLLGIDRDITRQRALEEALEQQVAERTAELQAALASLEREALENRRIQAALRESEVLFRTTLDALEVRVQVAGPDSRILWANKAFLDLVRDNAVESDPIGRLPRELFPHLPPSTDQEYRAVLEAQQPLTTLEDVRMGGTRIVSEVHKLPIIEHDRVSRIVTVIRDLSEQSRAQDMLTRQNAILRAIASAAETLLSAPGWQDAAQGILTVLGETVEVDRVYIFENLTDADRNPYVRQSYEWTAPGVEPQIDNPLLQRLPLKTWGLEPWMRALEQNRAVYGHVRDFSPQVQALLTPQSVLSILIMPIFKQDHLWGFIGFDCCTAEHDWHEFELGTLQVAANLLGQAIDYQAAQDSLRAGEDRFRSFVEQSRDGVRISNEQGIVLEWNRANEEITGLKRADVVGRPVWDVNMGLLPPEQRGPETLERLKVHDRNLRLAFAHQRELTDEIQFQRPDGEWRIAERKIFPLETEQGLLIGAITRDVTEQRQAADALRLAAARQEAFLQAIPDIIFRVDRAGVFLDCRAAHPEDLIVPMDQIIGKSMAEILPPHMGRRAIQHLQLALEHRRLESFQYALVLEGEERWFEARLVPSGPDEAIIFVRNVNELKKIEHQAFELALERERSEILRDFIQDASHEFGNPLSVIKNDHYLIALLPDAERREQRLASATMQVLHIERLVRGLLTMARLDQEVEFDFAPLDPNRVVSTVAQALEAQIQRRQHTLTLDLDARVPQIEADERTLYYALNELVLNAVQFTPDGGSIVLRTLRREQAIVIEVCDTGIGIAAEHVQHLFDRFFRVDPSRAERGAGLGLPIARKIVERHGGHIDVESVPGAGSTFRVFLPIPSA